MNKQLNSVDDLVVSLIANGVLSLNPGPAEFFHRECSVLLTESRRAVVRN